MARGDAAGFDACVVGGGMAGLSAALMLGRARRATLVADTGTVRNAAARAVHGVLGHDGTPPERLRVLAWQQVAGYPDVTVAGGPVAQVAGKADAFEIVLADGQCYRARRVLLATGVADELPPIEGLRPLWGRTVVHCPYCHGWELRGQPLAFLILRPADVFLGLKLAHLSSDVVGLLNGAPDPPPAAQEMLRAAGITLRAEPIARLGRDGDRLRQVIFTDGMCLDRAGLFVHPPARQAAPFAASLGCDMLPDDIVAVDDLSRTSVPGVYAAGDMGRRPDMPLPGQLAAVAAAAGTLTAVAADQELLLADTGAPLPWPAGRDGNVVSRLLSRNLYMHQGDFTTGSGQFAAAGTAAEPGGLIRFLDVARTLPALRAAKQALLEQLALGRARHALDVGCGIGGDLAEMARLMPDGAQVSGLDASETMITEARRRTASLGTRVSLRVGDAADLPYPDQMFDACRAVTVLQHVRDPARVVREMARVTRPGGRVGALEFDQGTTFLDHPDPGTTRIILDTFISAAVQGQMGRQLPRLFRAAGLTDVSVTPRVILGSVQVWRILFHDHVAQLQGEGLLTSQQTSQWWAELETWAQAGDFIGGAAVFVVTASRRVEGPGPPRTPATSPGR